MDNFVLFLDRWMPWIMVGQYAVLTIITTCSGKTAAMLYWFGATVLTVGVTLMSKGG